MILMQLILFFIDSKLKMLFLLGLSRELIKFKNIVMTTILHINSLIRMKIRWIIFQSTLL